MRSRWWIKTPRFDEHCGCQYFLIYRGNWTRKYYKRCKDHERTKEVPDNEPGASENTDSN